MRNKVEVLLFREWDNPKDEERRKKYTEIMRDTALRERFDKLGVIKSRKGWADGTGHIISLMEFESMEDFAKLWNDIEFQRVHVRFYRVVDNFRIRICRPSSLDPITLEITER
jgi:hypothetical protein